MGVTYKLTDDVVQFILDQKKLSPHLSCRELVDLVDERFDRVVSKSSVHEVLKEAHIVSPRGRKFKNKFQIPDDKKAQLIANLPQLVIADIPAITPPVETRFIASNEPKIESAPVRELELVEEQLHLRVEPMIPEPQPAPVVEQKPMPIILPPLEEGEIMSAKDFFLQVAFYDLFPKAWGAIKTPQELYNVDKGALDKEAAYRDLQVASFKVELNDTSSFYMDARQHTITRAFEDPIRPKSLEAATIHMADTLLNNLKPLIIRKLEGEFLDAGAYDFIKAMNNVVDKQINRIVLLDAAQETMIDFVPVAHVHRDFIMGVDAHNKDVNPIVAAQSATVQWASTYVLAEPLRFASAEILMAGTLLRGLVILSENNDPDIVLLSNMDHKISNQDLILTYMQTFATQSSPIIPGQMQGQDFLRTHAAKLFGNAMFNEETDILSQTSIKTQYNATLKIITIEVPNSYDKKGDLKAACLMLNNLDVIDQQGRKIWVRL